LFSPRRNAAITEGEQLLRTFIISHRVVVISEFDRARVEHHLAVSGINQVADIVDSSVAIPDQPLRHRQIEIERAKGAVFYVVTPDPSVAEWVIQQGIPALFFAHPSFSEPHRRPEGGQKPWDDLVRAVEDRAIKRFKRE
jgi:hypothetical protein